MDAQVFCSRALQSGTGSPLFKISKLLRCSPRLQTLRPPSAGISGANLSHDLPEKANYMALSNTATWESLLSQLHSRPARPSSPKISLRDGHWVKLICGASFEDIAEVRNLSLVYTLAGVDCIDCAADPAVVAAVLEGVSAAKDVLENVASREKIPFVKPWIMISVNDDVDPHFRKAEFNSEYCPSDCPRPCERVCPALAIRFQEPSNGQGGVNKTPLDGGIVKERCYGCGRCLPVCPLGLISAKTYVRSTEAVASLIQSTKVDAIEIHTGAGHLEAFKKLMEQLGSALCTLKLVAVSVPDLDEAMVPTLATMYTIMQPYLKHLNLWQLDGRPMSGDIGAGATRAAVDLAARVAASTNRPPGYLQPAGGTNAHTVTAMKKKGLCGTSAYPKEVMAKLDRPVQSQNHETEEKLIAGVAYGGYARKVVSRFLEKMQDQHERDYSCSEHQRFFIEDYPSLMMGALQEAITLVGTVKNAYRS